MQYFPLRYSESCLLGTPVTQQPCVFFPTVKLNFLFQKPIEQGSAFFVSTIFCPEVANSVYFLSMK